MDKITRRDFIKQGVLGVGTISALTHLNPFVAFAEDPWQGSIRKGFQREGACRGETSDERLPWSRLESCDSMLVEGGEVGKAGGFLLEDSFSRDYFSKMGRDS